MNAVTMIACTLIGIVMLSLVLLWALGHLMYADGVIYLTFHRNAEDSIAPVTSGFGLRLPLFLLVLCGLVGGLCSVAVFFSTYILGR